MIAGKINVGFIGLGSMGSGIAANICKAGYKVVGYDIEAERTAAAQKHGLLAAASVSDLIQSSDVVCTSLPHPESFVSVAESSLIPECREGLSIIDFGTSLPGDTIRICAALRERGGDLLDAAVSGGPAGAADGKLRIFAGGSEDLFERHHPILRAVGDPSHIVYCGKSGNGQIVKGVNQLLMGLSEAAVMEAFSYGVNAGIDARILDRAIGGQSGSRGLFTKTARKVTDGTAREIGVKFGQLAGFLSDATAKGTVLPLSQALYSFLEGAEHTITEASRTSPSFWNEITNTRNA